MSVFRRRSVSRSPPLGLGLLVVFQHEEPLEVGQGRLLHTGGLGGQGGTGGLRGYRPWHTAGCLVIGGRLWHAYGIGSVGGLGTVAFSCAPVVLGESGHEVPVDSVVPGRVVIGVAGSHRDEGSHTAAEGLD